MHSYGGFLAIFLNRNRYRAHARGETHRNGPIVPHATVTLATVVLYRPNATHSGTWRRCRRATEEIRPARCLRRLHTDLTTGPSCRMCSSRISGRSRLRSRWMKVRVSCTSTDGTSVKSSVSPCQIWSPAERYVELRYRAAVVSAVNRDTDTKMELGRRILAQSAIRGDAALLAIRTSITAAGPAEDGVGPHSAAAHRRSEVGWMFSRVVAGGRRQGAPVS